MLLAIYTTQVKKSKKDTFKKIKKNKVTKNLLQGNSKQDPPNQIEFKVTAFIHCTTSLNADNSRLKKEYIPSVWWLAVFKDDVFVFVFFFTFRVELIL